MSTSEKAIAEASAVSSKKQAQALSLPTNKHLHSTGKQTSNPATVELYSTPTSKHVPAQLYTAPLSNQSNPKQHSTSSSTDRPQIEPLPSVTISTKSSSQTLREFRKGRPTSNSAATPRQKVLDTLEAIQQRHGPAMQKVSCLIISHNCVFFHFLTLPFQILNSGSGLQVTVSKGKSDARVGKVIKMQSVKNTDHDTVVFHKEGAKSGKAYLESPGQKSMKKAKDYKEAMRGQSIQKSRSPAPSPLCAPKPSKALSLERKDVEMPTLHIPQKTEKASSTMISQGHPGLPNGLLWMTSSLIHNSNNKMALKESKGASVTRKEPSLKKLAPLSIGDDQFMDRPPRLVAQVPAKQLDDNSFSKLIEKSLANEAGSRSRLQLKPATSPKLRVEDYAMVPPPSAFLSKPSVGRPPKVGSGNLANSNLAESTKRSCPGEGGSSENKTSTVGEKKTRKERRSGSLAKASKSLVAWSKRCKDPPKNSGGWSWKGEGFVAKVHLNVSNILHIVPPILNPISSQNEEVPVDRICFTGMRHEEGDEEVAVKDCILLASGSRKKDLPYVAKVNSLWENPDDGKAR